MIPLPSILLAAALPAARAGTPPLTVGFEDGAGRQRAEAWIEEHGGSLLRCFHRARFCTARLPVGAPLDELAALPGLRYAERDRPVQGPGFDAGGHPLHAAVPSAPPEDYPDAAGTEDCPDQWELAQVRAFEAWSLADGRWAPVVAIEDGGFLLDHEELAGRISGQFDYGDWDDEAELNWAVTVPAHGTFIAGMIAAVPDNGLGRAGLAPMARLNLQKIADSDGAFYYSYAASAMADLAEGDLGVRVLSYSIASSSYTESFRDAVEALGDAGILLVAAAGNCSSAHCSDADNDSHPLYPASFSYEHVLAVAGSTRDDELNPYSHYGAGSVDLAAPGVDLCSCGAYGEDDFYTSGGTSYATPLVAAAAALLWEAHPDLTAVEVARVLRASAHETEALRDLVRADGRLDAYAALRTAVPRLEEPQDAVVEGEGTLWLLLENAGAGGEGWLVFSYGEAVDLVGLREAGGEAWSLEVYGPGGELELPDAGRVEVPGETRIAVGRGSLPEHGALALELRLRGRRVGTWPLTVRLVATSEGADYLNAPYDQGERDPTGFLAWTAQLRVTGTTADTGWEDTGAGGDTGAGSAGDTGAGEKPGGCACGGAAPPALPALLLAALGLLRRRKV